MKWKIFAVVMVVFWVVNLGFSQSNTIKPVLSAPDYNGTYEGSSNTGSARYTTLFRDNQDNGNRSGCRGEGCGKHPGVDIAVSSGTSVYNPIAGTVVVSRCDNSWGGLLVIRSSHVTRPWENIYQTFAHLRDRRYSNGLDVQVGDFVDKARLIGQSGGNGKIDKCSGNSTGAHLHYQIDKDDGNVEPWYPATGTVHNSDSNFEVSTKTYNPMVFIQNGYKWNFEGSNNRELWDVYNWSSWGVSGGAFWMDGGFDPYIRRGGLTSAGLSKPASSSIEAPASEYSQISLDLFNGCYTSYGKIYFTTNEDSRWDETKTIYYYPPVYGSYRSKIYTGWHYKWRGIITGLRIDPAENCLPSSWDPIYFGEIALTR